MRRGEWGKGKGERVKGRRSENDRYKEGGGRSEREGRVQVGARKMTEITVDTCKYKRRNQTDFR